MKSLLFIGFGDVARRAFTQLLLLSKEPVHFIIAMRDPDSAERFINTQYLSAIQNGRFHKVEIRRLDVHNVDETAALLTTVNPDLIFSGLCLMSYWRLDEIFYKKHHALLSRPPFIDPLFFVDLCLILKFMRIAKACNMADRVINAAYPDVTHPILAKVGLSPLCGIGNIANNVPGIKTVVVQKKNCALEDIDIILIGHHYVSYNISRLGHSAGAPYIFRVYIKGRDVTEEFGENEIFEGLVQNCKRLSGQKGQNVTASSAVSVLYARLFGESQQKLHAPGIHGLAGGYAVLMSRDDLSVRLPEQVTLEECIAVNTHCLAYDGIQEIRNDGTVIFNDRHKESLVETVGLHYETMRIADCEDMAVEFVNRVKAAA